MSNPEPFTWASYCAFLDRALSAGYDFIGFGRLRGTTVETLESVILLRHDVDYDPVWAERMAAIEAEAGVRSTYCFQPDSHYYGVEDEVTVSAIQAAVEHGHWLGLHFDATEIPDDDEVAGRVAEEAARLEERYETPVHAVSFHMPGRRPVGQIQLGGKLINSYRPDIFEGFSYISDSNQNWRGKDLDSMVSPAEHPRLQVLIHPIWWRESHSPMIEKLRELADDLGIELDELITVEQQELLRAEQAG